MLIDVHAHQFTAGMFNQHPFWGPYYKAEGLTVGHWTLVRKTPVGGTGEEAQERMLQAMTHEARLKTMAERGVDRLVLSTPSHAYMYWAGEFGDEYARKCNDELAAYSRVMPDKFDFWAHANLANPKEAAKELKRAIVELGAKGLAMGGANFGGIEVHDERLYPVWDVLVEHDLPTLVHGYNQSIWWGDKWTDDKFDTTSVVGDLVDETLYFWYLINGGVLDAFPTLKSYITHAGGMTPFQLGRLEDLTHYMVADTRKKRPLTDYLPNFYFDLDLHAASLRRAVVDVIGANNLLYGTNFGGAYSYGDLTADVGLSEEDRLKIRSGNAIALLKITTDFAAV